jgi:hypothetical protein
LLRDIEKIVVPQPSLARDAHELSHDGGFAFSFGDTKLARFATLLAFIPVFPSAFYFAFWRLCEIVFSPPVSLAT